MARDDVLPAEVAAALGAADEPLASLAPRVEQLFPGKATVLWECDASSFVFSYVSPSAVALLGYPAEAWLGDSTFWSQQVVHPDDRSDAVAFCALATAKRSDHIFEYRALAADGRIVWLRDLVHVVRSRRDVPAKLRGVMVDITAERQRAGLDTQKSTLFIPSLDRLRAAR